MQKQKCSIDDKNEWKYTHNHQHPPRASVLWQNRNEGKKLFWMADGSIIQNRLTFSRIMAPGPLNLSIGEVKSKHITSQFYKQVVEKGSSR